MHFLRFEVGYSGSNREFKASNDDVFFTNLATEAY
jgi:hypothetical protein